MFAPTNPLFVSVEFFEVKKTHKVKVNLATISFCGNYLIYISGVLLRISLNFVSIILCMSVYVLLLLLVSVIVSFKSLPMAGCGRFIMFFLHCMLLFSYLVEFFGNT